jgi:hypothetical protein
MSLTARLWENAEEAMLAAQRSKSASDKQVLLELARAWTRAALRSEGANNFFSSQHASISRQEAPVSCELQRATN